MFRSMAHETLHVTAIRIMSSIAASIPRVCFESPYQCFSKEPHFMNTGSSENSNVQAIAQDDEIRNICGKDLGIYFHLYFPSAPRLFQ